MEENKIKNNMRVNAKNGNIIVSFVIIAVVIFSLCAFGIDMSILFMQRAKLQSAVETTALAAASLYDFEESEVKDEAVKTFSYVRAGSKLIKNAQLLNVEVKSEQKAVKVFTQLSAQTYFLAALGVGHINLQARASAKNTTQWLSSTLPVIVNSQGVVISKGAVAQNTEVRKPLGILENTNVEANLYGEPDGKTVSLGSGGMITLRLPYLMIDKKGEDLFVKETGHEDGYFIYAGIDNDPTDPYLDETNKGGGIRWSNISCLAKPNPNLSRVYNATVNYFVQAKVYGSAYFDLSKSCSDGTYKGDMKVVKYLKIIDDSAEDGFENENSISPSYFIGESSSSAPGADIDAVGVLNHTKLIKSSEFDSL